MKRFLLLMAPLGLLLACPVLAQNDEIRVIGRGRDPERMQQMLDRFDNDGDGQLSREERQTAREAHGDRQPGRREPAAEGDRPLAVHVEIDERRATAQDGGGNRARKGHVMVAGLVAAVLAVTPTAGRAAEVHAESSVRTGGWPPGPP